MVQPFATFIVCMVVLLVSADELKTDDKNKVIDIINDFGVDLYNVLAKSDGNLVCSGFGVSTILNMLLLGARKDTEKELRHALHYDTLSLTRMTMKSYHEILTNLSNHNGYYLDVANSIWIQSGFDILPEFKDTIERTFYAEEQETDFSSPLATEKINSWVSKETKNKISKVFDDPLDADTRLVLVNAMYFKGTWEVKFNESFTKLFPFHLDNDNAKKDVLMMNVRETFPYHEDSELKAQVLELPYDGDDVSMVIVLPKAVDGLAKLQEHLTLKKLKTVIDNLKDYTVTVKIPKFQISSTLRLTEVLKSLGIKQVFTREADLLGIDGKRDLFVSDAVQKTTIEVNEEGTVAAAASGTKITARMSGIMNDEAHFIADHSFFYFIRHKPTGIFLFMGRFTET